MDFRCEQFEDNAIERRVNMEITKAIEILKVREQFVADINIETKMAYTMAIEALDDIIQKGEEKMKVKKAEIVASCNECGCTEFYLDDNNNFWCVECGEPHQGDDFNLLSRTFEGDYDIDLED